MKPSAAAVPDAVAVRFTCALWLAAVAVAFLVVYRLSNELTSRRDDVGYAVFEWERAIPFVEWTIVPYLSIGVLFALSFFVDREAPALGRHAARLLLALAISVACYAAFPLRFAFERPPTSGLPGLLFEALAAFDPPYNRAPSLHISVLLIVWARLVPHAAGWRRSALHAWCGCIAVSVLTTYQHHVIDVPAGVAVGLLCVVAWRSRGARTAAQPARETQRGPYTGSAEPTS